MDNTQQFNDEQYEAAMAAARNFTPDSIKVFQGLGPIETEVVIKVLKALEPPPKKKRSDAGVKRTKATA